MAKGSGAKMLYFVLYIVLITELLIVITERDELEESQAHIREKMLGSIANSYKMPIKFNVSSKTLDYNVGAKDGQPPTEVFSVQGLVSEEEMKALKFFVDVAPGSKRPDGWPAGGINSDNANENFQLIHEGNGTAKCIIRITSEGDYIFTAYCTVERKFPGYLEGTHLMESLKQMVGAIGAVTSNTDNFTIRAKRQGGVVKKGAEIVM